MQKLEIKNLRIKLKDEDKEIVSDASFSFNKGEIILITGINGSGKSSLLSSIFKHPNFETVSGDIVLEKDNDKESLINLKTFEIVKKGLYLSMQHVPEIDGVNLLQFLYRAHKNIFSDSDISILDFHNQVLDFCKKFEINEKFLERDLNVGFSGGEKKQAEMLHIFALKPNFIFMDEPDSGVDKDAVKKVFEIIKYFQKENNSAFCIVSHNQNLDEYIKVDRVYEMKDKKLSLK